MSGVFISGTDTGVGKTLVAACLVRAWAAAYWKPVQTGLAEEEGDSRVVARLAGLAAGESGAGRLFAPVHELAAPLAPEPAAAAEGRVIRLADFVLPKPPGSRPLVVEGAGGLLVPLCEGAMIIDLIARLGLPVVLVARSTLGTLNHTLLSLEALRARRLPVAGVVLNGPANPGNRATIERLGQVRILAELPPLNPVDAAGVAGLATAFGEFRP
jgi:malonyl-CoA O-methyltransferase